ncbi:MAG: response regulator [Spirochaetales bacterium]|nr:response regulator [Spirochaetales bacterium]
MNKNSIFHLFSKYIPLAILIPVLILISFCYLFFTSEIIRLTNAKKQFIVTQFTAQIESILSSTANELETMDKLTSRELEKIFIEYKKIHPFINAFFFINKDGTIKKSIPDMDFHEMDLSEYEEFKIAVNKSQPVWVNSFHSNEKNTSISYFYPLKNDSDTTEIVGLSLNYNKILTKILNQCKIDNKSKIFITTNDNTVLYSSDNSESLYDNNFNYSKTKLKNIIKSGKKLYLYNADTINQGNLTLYFLLPGKELFDILFPLTISTLIFIAIILFFTILFSYYGKRYISEPIISFADASTQLALGNYIKPQSHAFFHEIKVLSENFYTMATQILDNKKSLSNSEKKFRALVEESVDMIFRMNRNLRLTYISPSVGALLGYGEKELKDLLKTPGENRNDIFPNKIQNSCALRSIIKSFEEDSIAKPFVITIRHSNQSLLYFEVYMHRLKDKRNELELQGSARNITQRYLAEQKVFQLQDYFHDVINSVSSGVLTFNECFTVDYFNTSFLNIFQTDAANVANWHLKDISPILNNNLDLIEQMTKSGSRKTFSFKKDVNGQTRFYNVTVFPMTKRKNIFILHVFDITSLKENQQQQENEKNANFIKTLAGGLAHDLNNITGGLTGTLDLIDYKQIIKNNTELQEDMINIRKAIMRGQQIINKIVSISQVDKSRFTSYDLHQLVCDVSKTFETHGMIFIDNIKNEAIIDGDGEMLGTMFNYLISCIQKITPTAVSMNFSSVKKYDEIFYQIILHNPQLEMSQDDLDNLFVPFFRTQTLEQHFGLDLTFAYTVIHNHKGSVSCISDNGVKITILLPAKKGNVTPPTLPNKTSETKNKLIHGSGKILLIDDEDIVRYTAMKILQMCGYEVLPATNGTEAIQLFEENNESISCVIIDFFLPDMNGLEIFEKLQQINNKTKVILNSAMQNHPKVVEAMKHGFYDFLPKPFTIETLSGIVAKAIQEEQN